MLGKFKEICCHFMDLFLPPYRCQRRSGGVNAEQQIRTNTNDNLSFAISAHSQTSSVAASQTFRIRCPVCNNEFASEVIDRQINHHIDGCLIIRELELRYGSDWQRLRTTALRGRWIRRMGVVVNGVIVFENTNSNDSTSNDITANYNENGITSNSNNSNTSSSSFSLQNNVNSVVNSSVNASLPMIPCRHDSNVDNSYAQNEDSDALARSLLYLLRDDFQYGGTEEVTKKRYLNLRLTNSREFFPIASFTYEQKKQWFYAQLNSIKVNYSSSWVVIDVSRENLLINSYNEFRSLGPHDLHKELKICFAGEKTQDAGGVSREWFTLLIAELLNPNLGLFSSCDSDNLSYTINPYSNVNENHLEYFHFAGRVIAKAIYDQQTILFPIARHILKQLLKHPIDLDDLAFTDPQLHSSLIWMMDNSVEGIVFETFSVDEDRFGKTEIVDLKDNGRNIELTDENKSEYLELILQYKLSDSIKEQTNSFVDGFWEVIPLSLMRVFNFQELDLLINGLPIISVDDWKQNTEYGGDYHANHEDILWFWDSVTNHFTEDERARLLQFATGTSRIPSEGFIALQSNRGQNAKFTIHSMDFSALSPYPKAHTCFNRLYLPKYKTKTDLQKYLRYPLQMEVTGFGLNE